MDGVIAWTGSGFVCCIDLPVDDATHGSVVQADMGRDLRLGIAIVQMQGGDEPVARPAMLRKTAREAEKGKPHMSMMSQTEYDCKEAQCQGC